MTMSHEDEIKRVVREEMVALGMPTKATTVYGIFKLGVDLYEIKLDVDEHNRTQAIRVMFPVPSDELRRVVRSELERLRG